MKIYDITRELLSCSVYPGDPPPECENILNISQGNMCNLSYLKMCAHNGTHMDAPSHFIEDGKTIDEIPLEQVVGICSVIEYSGKLNRDHAEKLLKTAAKKGSLEGKYVVYNGCCTFFVERGVELLGVESQTVGSSCTTIDVHQLLLASGMVILEGLYLENIKTGTYFLYAPPLKIAKLEGAPCRAVLIDLDDREP